MENLNQYEVHLYEDEIVKDETGRVVHHPLNSPYCFADGRDMFSYGHLTFGGHDLDKSSILDDVRVFFLEFWGEPEGGDDRKEWADSLRAEVLSRLTGNNRCWYLSMIDINHDDVGDALRRILGTQLNQIEVQSERAYGDTYGFWSRQFFVVPNNHLREVVRHFWPRATPGYPIEGYSLETGQIELFRQWDSKPRDDQLFRDVIDRTFVNFYTFPAEHREFAFVTNKLNYAELAGLIGLDELQQRAKEMGHEKK